nr:SEC-C domain-containing protein [Chloroflexota bacterium]
RVTVQRQAPPPPMPSPEQVAAMRSEGAGGTGDGLAATAAGGRAATPLPNGGTTGATAPMLSGVTGGGRPGTVRLQRGDEELAPVAAAAKPALPKVGRNDPCHCGSGLKFKKCHGR